LNQGQIGGIVHLVSSSIEGMQPQNVTVIDNMGNLLSKAVDVDEMVDSKKLDYQKSVDRDYEGRLQSMLEGIIGRGKAIVRVATKIDFTRVEKTEEKFDPDTIAVRSEQRAQEKSTGAVTGGIPGVLSNQPGQQTAAVSPSSSQKQSENINYEISRSVSRIIQPRGEVKNISVAVLVDGTYKKEKDKKVYVPRNESEIKKYKEIIMAAIGYNKDRGDQVIVENVPFEVAIEELPPAKIDYIRIATSLLKYLIPLVVVALLILFVIKPIIEVLKAPAVRKIPEEAKIGVPLPAVAPEVTVEEVMKEEVTEMVKKEPRRAAMLLKEWLSE
jgi:flagellar M-ring protein FliF